MNEATAESLGDKLATLDLTDDEAITLALLLGGRPNDDAEVDGFINIGVGELQEFVPGDQFRTIVGLKLGPPTKDYSWGASQSGTTH